MQTQPSRNCRTHCKEMGMPTLVTLRPFSLPKSLLAGTLTLALISHQNRLFSPSLRRSPPRSHLSTAPSGGSQRAVSSNPSAVITGAEEVLLGFITGKRKATEIAHLVWKHIVQRGDTAVDATCGNGYDTLALLKMVADDESGRGCVYGMDIQKSALDSTFSLLEKSVGEKERRLVKLSSLCHSKMEEVVPKNTPVRVVAFNLGYLPGGDKGIITLPETTIMALKAASKIVMSGGLISLLVYVGHPGGRDELEGVLSFASSLPAETWVSHKFEILNRPSGPILVLLFKK